VATWDDWKGALRRDFTLDEEGPDEFSVTVERPSAKGREQRVMARRNQAWGQDVVEIRSAFGQLGDYDPATLLQDSLKLPLGAIALHGRYLVVVQRAPLAHTTTDGLSFLLTRVAWVADLLEEQRGADRF
jgi:hypothetical protein